MGDAADEAEADAMTDTPPPKRRFWQIHLSTAVVMIVVLSFAVGIVAHYFPTGETDEVTPVVKADVLHEACVTIQNCTGKPVKVWIESKVPLDETDKKPFDLHPNYETYYWFDVRLTEPVKLCSDVAKPIIIPSLDVGSHYKYCVFADGEVTFKMIPEKESVMEVRRQVISRRSKP
jgi:hypothetical protein